MRNPYCVNSQTRNTEYEIGKSIPGPVREFRDVFYRGKLSLVLFELIRRAPKNQ